MPRRPTSEHRYLLGDSSPEAARLRAQAKLWDPTAHALFDRVRVRRRWRVLEIGPGMGSLHLELRRRVLGPIDAVEPSLAFRTRLARLCARDGLGTGNLWGTRLLETPLPRGHYDFIFARWVFLFLPDPALHLTKLVSALKPGGALAIEDYHRETLAMIPRPPEWDDFLAADRAFFASQGGNASVGGALPGLFARAGLEVTQIVPTLKLGRPGTAEWNWLSDYFLGVMDRYAAFRPLSRAKAARLARRWRAAATEPTSLLIAPALLDVVGRKPR